jgi:microsomal dipeptidase-like Zn-dependent dipeptidase
MRVPRAAAIAATATVTAAVLARPALDVASTRVERRLNGVQRRPPYTASGRAWELHRSLSIVDLHADSLLWGRDLAVRSDHGHLDVPRLIEGNVTLQALAACVKVPRGLNVERNEDRSDAVTLLAVANRWPRATWRGLLARTLYIADRARELTALPGGRFTLVATAADLRAYLARRSVERRITAGLLTIEGAQGLEDDPANLDVVADAGFRILGLTHFVDNAFAGSAHGVEKGGLTPLGRDLVERAEGRSVLVDLAHASVATIDDVLSMATRPVVVSHTGVQAVCPSVRNLSDEHLRAVSGTGGLVGIGFFPTLCCGDDAVAIARSIRHAVDVAGIEHVALGSDFDGAVTVPFDVTGLVQLTDSLLSEGFTGDEVRAVMGRNVLRLLEESLR